MDRPKEGPKASGEDERVEFATFQPSALAGTPEDLEKEGRVESCSRAEQRRISRKLDVRIIFPLGLMLAASMFDRGNIGNAAIAGYVPSVLLLHPAFRFLELTDFLLI